MTQSLRKLIDPYFMRRTKEDVGMVDSVPSDRGAADGKYVVVATALLPVTTLIVLPQYGGLVA